MSLSRVAFSPSTLFLLLFLLIPGETNPKSPAAHSSLKFAGTAEPLDGNLLLISGVFGPGDFFKGLHSIDSTEGRTFVNDYGEVQFFPNEMTINVSFTVLEQDDDEKSAESTLKTMRELKFRACWKRGTNLRAVGNLKQVKVSTTRVSPNFLIGPQAVWTYEFVIEDSQVPLTDHFVFYVMSPDSKQLARFSASI